MENRLPLIAVRFWNAWLKPFLLAVLLGILAGAFLNSLAHAGPAEVKLTQPQVSPFSVCANDGCA